MQKILSYFLIVITIFSLAIASIPSPSIYRANYIEFYDINGNLIDSQINNKHGEYMPLEALNKHTIDAFIAFEDKNFYSHKGFDSLRIFKSVLKNLFSFSFSSGASTITQQYARTIFLSNQKTITRKLKEAYYTIKLERKYTKKQILEGYLNSIYLGHGCYGIDAASRYYFNKSSKDLSLEESATLASLPSSPTNSSPYINYNKSKYRRNLVLKAMKDEGYIDSIQYQESINNDIVLNERHTNETNLNYYLDKVKEDIKSHKISLRKGLKVYTNIDVSLFNKINSIMNNYNFFNNQFSLIIFENNSNKVLLDVGGYNYNKSNYNRSLYSSRQIGSTIKTFLYSLALETNFTTETLLKSEKTTFKIKDYGDYSPSNSNDIYANKNITMKEAYAVSDNIYAVKTLLLLGSDTFVKYLKKFNLDVEENVPSIALGTCEMTLFDLLKAYSVYSNNGYYYNYDFINKITDSYNNVIYTSNNTSKQILNKPIVNQVKELMTLPFYNNNYYTKSTLENYSINGYYGKSGSTKTDSYLILFNDKYTIGAWLGNDKNENLYDYTTVKYLLKDIIKEI